MARRTWAAEEFERLTSAEQDAIFESSIVSELDDIPEPFLAYVRSRLWQRLGRHDAPSS
jgi:hypothetical protein